MSFSAVSPLKRSISFCLSSKKVCSRWLRERQYATQFLYNSFSFLITAQRKCIEIHLIIIVHINWPLSSCFNMLDYHSTISETITPKSSCSSWTNTNCTDLSDTFSSLQKMSAWYSKPEITLFDCSRGKESALFDILFSSVQCWWQKLFSLHIQH